MYHGACRREGDHETATDDNEGSNKVDPGEALLQHPPRKHARGREGKLIPIMTELMQSEREHTW